MIREVELKYQFPDAQSYSKFLNSFPGEHFVENQTNYFFDTPALTLKTQHVFLRLRKSNEKFKFTCKAAPKGVSQPSDTLSIHDEWEQLITAEQAMLLLTGNLAPLRLLEQEWPHESANSAQTRLSLLERIQKLTRDKLSLMGSFSNKRIHVPYSPALTLEVDATDFGHGRFDYELELELPPSISPEKTDAELRALFQKLGVQTQPSSGKAERFFKTMILQ